MIKDKDEHPDEDIHGTKSESVPNVGASVSMQLGCATFPVHECVHQPGSSPNPVLRDFCGGCIVYA